MLHQDIWQVLRSDVDNCILMVESSPHEQFSVESRDGRIDAKRRRGGLILPYLKVIIDPEQREELLNQHKQLAVEPKHSVLQSFVFSSMWLKYIAS